MKMKRFMAMAIACVMAAGLVACGGSESTATTSTTDSTAATSTTASTAEETTADLSGAVATGGSTSVEKVIGALGEAFMEANPSVDVTYDPTGSGAGVTGAADGTLDIGLSSRALKDEEKAQGLKETTFALDGIAIVVNTENTVEDLSLEQIAKLATGEITNWSEVGGPDAPVVLIGREAGSGTRDGFESIVGVEDKCAYEQELTSTGAVLAGVAANPNAFGYVSLASVDDTVKMVTVDGVTASEETVKDGSYKIQRPFVFVTKDGEELSAQAQAFYDFALSEDAAELIAAAGAVPMV
ncbi:phosphate ABC transporter substrate-binding protein (PhoT family) [Allofournierella massiliensis]|uniref:Phosphate-binding protein n=2 Tax=Allofournierella massiliensis TaxID=1650663 RepID=A0A4V2QC20_9FIRM|nr:phosphate ABC transporter substrate-binding protein [Fournierella massiliensis]TCL58247.1 phosphate ABC transporter substrate-binding protein (PhoT family) [Fournierella massiliensis]